MVETNILVVEDDAGVRKLLRSCLESEGYTVQEATSAAEVRAAMSRIRVHLITLDLNLDRESGLDIAQEVRKASDVPIIMVTAKDDLIDRVVGLEIGADDYVSKPFHVRELLARVHSVLRRSGERPAEPAKAAANASRELCFAGFRAVPDKLELTGPDGQIVDLTAGDYRLLTVFLESPRRVLSREQIMDILNGPGWSPYDRTIDNQVARLRKKIEAEPGAPKLIKTVRGVGYIFTPEVTLTAGDARPA
ncbi:response regulator transcription factor [Defluviimonas sp. WL0024]|uniref:Response regulator transcription factor n=2 Tax=Albidovulum TaxID=205889 RepID=A0ABT3J250_9RHOB|nr:MULTISPECIES: response regulator transcription factor [Defluviimonas]MCU9847548.1 response regulator transcription factor [Defluviimonas sp. WL0024]MCW3781740.1 response regulator transcription factor [Defluviimonas salinarum]